jgi:hypothetical protein
VHRRRDAIHAHRDAARGGDFRRDLGRRQHAAVAGLGALRQLHLDHLDLRRLRLGREFFFIEAAIRIAAAEVAGGDLPDQVAAEFAVVFRDRAFAGIVGEAALLCALVQRADGVGRERAEAHRRDVEDRHRIRLRTVGADDDAEIVAGDLGRGKRVAYPFMAGLLHVQLGTEGAAVDLGLGALVDDAALLAREGRPSISSSKKYWRSSGRMDSKMKRKWPIRG